MESPTSFGSQEIDDHKEFGKDPMCEVNSETKFNTEEFLRHESSIGHNKPPESTTTETNLKNDSASSGDSKIEERFNDDFINSDVTVKNHPVEPKISDSDSDNMTDDCKLAKSDSEKAHFSSDPSNLEQNISHDIVNESGRGPIVSENVNNLNVLSDSPQATSESSGASTDEPIEPKEEWLDILGSGHLLKKVLKPGLPETRPNKSDICILSFTGRLEDGTVIEECENVQIHLNDNEVIQGIDFALALMDKGEEAELKVGPRFAYGSLGRKPDVPPGSTLFYNVKLLDIQDDPPIHNLPVNERISLGLKKKERGNWWYSRDEHSIAINCYRRALEFLDDTDIPEPHNDEEIHKLIQERLKTYNNLTASQMKIHAYDAALMSVNYVLTSQPQNVKALFRKSKILKEKGELPEAIKAVRLALSFDKDSPSLQQELSSLLAAQRKDNTKQRELYKKMLGTSSNQEKESGKKNIKNYSAIKWTSFLAFAIALVAGTVAYKYKM